MVAGPSHWACDQVLQSSDCAEHRIATDLGEEPENATMTVFSQSHSHSHQGHRLLPSTAILMGALTILPFMEGFPTISQMLTLIYLSTFACSLGTSLLFGASAVCGKRRPLLATRLTVAGLLLLSADLILLTLFVLTHVGTDPRIVLAASGGLAFLILTTWWALPVRHENR